MERESRNKSVVAGTGIIGGLVVFLFLALGPLTSTPAPSGFTLAMMLAYPALLFSTAFVGMWSMRAAMVLSAIAMCCTLIALAPVVRDERAFAVVWIALIVCSPAIAQVITTRNAVREEEQADEAWRVSRGFRAADRSSDHVRD